MLQKSQKKLLLLSSIGGVLEFYDFIIYALLAAYLSKAFFPSENKMTSLIGVFATFSAGYLVRPIGGIIFGHFGDKYGRKKTFTCSILLMAISTFCIALVPTFASIGIAAPIILTLLRLCQGLSVGGEIPGAIAYVSESMPTYKGLACGVVFFALVNGIVIGSLMHSGLVNTLSPGNMASYGWRIAFIVGGLFGFIGFYARKKLEESQLFQAIEAKKKIFPIAEICKKYPKNTLLGIFIAGLGASITTLLFLFTPSYLSQILHIHSIPYLWYHTLALFISTLLIVLFGALSDKISKRWIYFITALLTIILIYPIFTIYAHHFYYYLIALGLSTLLQGVLWGIIPPFLTELFPTHIRYSGIGVSYNFAFALFGGLTPLIAIALIEKTGLLIAPIFYIIALAVLALIALAFVRAQKNLSD